MLYCYIVELHNIPERLTDFIDVAWKFDWKFTEFYLFYSFIYLITCFAMYDFCYNKTHIFSYYVILV
jgi:hypothetical protein